MTPGADCPTNETVASIREPHERVASDEPHVVADGVALETWLDTLCSRLVLNSDQASSSILMMVVSSCSEKMPISLESITSKIKIIASRTQYLFPIPSMEKKENDKIDLFSDNKP